jgi:S1-C subfamily serine protease
VRLKRTPELQELVGRFRPGQELTVEYWRQGKKYKTRVVLKDSRNTTSVARVAGDELQDDIGIELRDVNKEEQRVLRMPGALVTSVKRGSIVYDTNMQPGFLITSVNGNRVNNASEAIDAIKRAYNSLALDGYYEGEPDLYSYRFKKRE